MAEYIDRIAFRKHIDDYYPFDKEGQKDQKYDFAKGAFLKLLACFPQADVVELPRTGIGELSDGYHTFNGLYKQRMILFAALVKAYKDRAWKSYRHEDGEYCFGGGWFIVGIDTPEGSYTYHYENKFWDMFDCPDLPRAKHWDGHTEADAETRLMSLPVVVERKAGKWETDEIGCAICSVCGNYAFETTTHHISGWYPRFCPNCGAKMIGGDEEDV